MVGGGGGIVAASIDGVCAHCPFIILQIVNKYLTIAKWQIEIV